ncbi:MAG TPA: PIN domain-containing protein [Acidimicrobiia bacterium]|nr:PIN domain-containing protein [Acidimicrobiia bacterium]
MIVDTSVWVQHLRKGEPRLREYLDDGIVMVHPCVIGELACGNIHNRSEVLSLLASLLTTHVVADDELLHFVETEGLYGRGMGWVDIHLLASARVSGVRLWTRDRRLGEAALALGVAV